LHTEYRRGTGVVYSDFGFGAGLVWCSLARDFGFYPLPGPYTISNL
jgi:hypothetical protein